MKIAIASSGLGVITRGIERWAVELAGALPRYNLNVTLFGRAGISDIPSCFDYKVFYSPGRESFLCRILSRILPSFTWRVGFKSPYGLEQFFFWHKIFKSLKKGDYDIFHVQDPYLAFWCQYYRKSGKVRCKEILCNGTEEPSWFLARFEYVHHLAPYHATACMESLNLSSLPSSWAVIPNFVDTEKFKPVSEDEKRYSREKLKIPLDAVVVGVVSAIKSDHKRINWFIEEAAECLKLLHNNYFFMIVGSSTSETPFLERIALGKLGKNVAIFSDVPFSQMQLMWNAIDIYFHPALFEMMPISILEAMAKGLPVIAHNHPLFQWIIAEGGFLADISGRGVMANCLKELKVKGVSRIGMIARNRVLSLFSLDVVVPQIVEYYKRVLNLA